MRTKIILPVSVLALVVVGSAAYFRFYSSPSAPVPAAEPVTAEADTNAAALPAILHQTANASTQVPAASDVPTQEDAANADTNSPEYQAYAAQTKADLAQMGASHDPAALPTILHDLNSHDPDIRRSAIDATMDYGNTNAISTLKNEMAWTDDLDEKVEIQKAIKFLEIPTLQVDAYGQIVK